MAHKKVGKIDGILESNSDVGITLGTLVWPVLCAFHLERKELDGRMRRERISRRRSRGREEEVGRGGMNLYLYISKLKSR